MPSLLSNFVNPDSVRQLARANEGYLTNRDRAGAVLHDGLSAYDTYQRFRPALFMLSLAGMAASAYGFWKRKKQGTEAMALYGASFVVSAVGAYVTRPSLGAPATSEAPPGSPADSAPAKPGALMGYIDKRVAALKAEDPDFTDKAVDRLVAFPSIKPSWDKVDPMIQAVIR